MTDKILIGKIVDEIQRGEKILIFPHISIDGDALGSAVSLCNVLRKLNKEAMILMEDEIPEYLKFISMKDYFTYDLEYFKSHDVSISVDCGDDTRYPDRKVAFDRGSVKISIDHHATTTAMNDLDYIDPAAAATGEMIYLIIKALEEKYKIPLMDKQVAEAIYVALVKDTGNFCYTNTRRETHLIVADLFNYDLDIERITVELFQSVRHEKLKLSHEVINTIEMFCDSKANLAYMTNEMLHKTGATKDEAEGLIDILRDIKGIEISAFLKENPDGNFKVSLRSKTFGDVGSIAMKYGGGGHRKASGFNAQGPIDNVIKLVKEEICLTLK